MHDNLFCLPVAVDPRMCIQLTRVSLQEHPHILGHVVEPLVVSIPAAQEPAPALV
jgi:hypothetical protein